MGGKGSCWWLLIALPTRPPYLLHAVVHTAAPYIQAPWAHRVARSPHLLLCMGSAHLHPFPGRQQSYGALPSSPGNIAWRDQRRLPLPV